MKKKIIIALLAIIAVVCCAFAVFMLGGCTADGDGGTPNQNQQNGSETTDGDESNPPAHTHQFSDKWTSDEVNHWHAATCGHTDKKDEAAHTYVNGVCEICDHAHVNHDFGSWVEDTPASETATGSRHKDCFCGYRVTEEIPKIDAFEFKQSGNGYAVIAYTGSLTELTVPAEHDGKPVTIIDENAFYDGAFTSIKLPATIKEIGKKAFGYCTQLKNIEIPNCARVGDSAFEGCAALQEITLPEDAISLGTTLFKYCSALQKVTVKGGTVQATTFSGAATVEEIILEERVTIVGTYAFRDCKNLQKLTMPRVDTSETFMFNYFHENKTSSSHLKLLTITNQQISVYNKVFEDCTCEIDIWVKFPVAKISVVGASEYYIDNFAEENYKLRVEYEDGFKEDFPLFGYISQEDQAAFRTAGSHEITATYQNKTCTAAISVLLHQFDEAALENAEYIFDGLPHSLSVTGVPEETEIVYTGNEQSEVGEHIVTAYLTKQYYEPKTLTATLNILKQQYDILYVLGLDGVTNDNPANYETNGRNVTLQNPARPGWEFAGWYTEASFSHKITEIKGNAHVDYILYAKWKTVFTLSGGAITGLTSYGEQQTELIIDETINGIKITSIADKAFYQNANLQKITLPSSITSIGGSAFSGCSKLTSIVIPDSITSIGESAFYYCKSLTSITIPDSVTSIGNYAFRDCTSLEIVNFGDNRKLKTIGERAFSGCTSLTSITIPDSVTSIGNYAFEYCTSLTGVYITNLKTWCCIEFNNATANPLYYAHSLYLNDESVTDITAEMLQGVTEIKNYAFHGCTSLESIEIPDGVTSIGSDAFYGCTKSIQTQDGVQYVDKWVVDCDTSVTSVNLRANTKDIADDAFYNCKSLTSITIPDSVTSVGKDAFYNCKSLTSITIPDSVTSIDNSAFEYCTNLETVYWNATNCKRAGSYELYGYNNTIFKGCTALTTVYIGENVESIPNYVFYECTSLESVTFGNNSKLQTIGYGAFDRCRNLMSITIPDGVTSIGEEAFEFCGSLASVNFGNNSKLETIGNYAFEYCTSLTSITIPDSVTSISKSAFEHCRSLASVNFGNNSKLETIESSAFSDCTSLASVIIGNGVTSIGGSAFSGCSKLTSIVIPDSVTSIGGSAFSGCSKLEKVYWNATNCKKAGNINYPIFSGCTVLTSIRIGENVKIIPDYAFKNCTSLASVNFGNNSKLKTIGAGAFDGCTSLESIEIPDGVTSIDYYVFYGCTSLTSITIPDSVISIGGYAFYNCTSLESISIPDGVTSIGEEAFCYCTSLESISIPDGVTSIGEEAFCYCTNLVTVYYGGDSTQWNGISIDDYNSNLKNATRYYFSENAPDTAKWAESENWWHYDPATGEIAIWKKD